MEQFFKKYNIIFLVIILALAVFFRLYQLKAVPPGLYPDEAMNGNNALEAIQTGQYKVFYPENNGREGLFINIQTLSLRIFGNEPWALRLVSVIFGIFTVLGLYFLTKELFEKETISLLASFFLAVSFWHINFSRIGFRAIMAPFFLIWGSWLVWKLIRKNNPYIAIIAGLVFGLGFYSYISFRIAPLLLLVPACILIKRKKILPIILFVIALCITVYPLLNYFVTHPADFLGRTTQISVFSTPSPFLEFGKNILLTMGMFFVYGDGNWRHNISGAPELWWPIAILFLIGFIISLKKLRVPRYAFLVTWLIVLLFPVLVSNEGIPHALRSIVVVPAAMIFAALGLEWLAGKINDWLRKQTLKFPESLNQLNRIKKELIILLFVFLATTAVIAYKQYFLEWASNPKVAAAFDENYTLLGNYLKYSPKDIKKYVIINTENEKVDFMPMPIMPVMFLTDTYLPERQKEKNIYYTLPKYMNNFIIQARRDQSLQIFMLKNDSLLRRGLSDNISGLFTYENEGILIQQK